MTLFVLVLVIAMAMPMATPVVAATIINVPSDYPTIQAAINNAHTGDIILVASGIYYENIVFYGKNGITLQSNSGALTTIIDGSDSGTVVKFDGTSDNVLDSFTIKNGRAEFGGVTFSEVPTGTLKNCIVQDNVSTWDSAIYISGSPNIINNLIVNNSSQGIHLYASAIQINNQSSPIIANNIIKGNVGGPAIKMETSFFSTPEIFNNVIYGNSGGGIQYLNASVANNIITNNGEFGIYSGGQTIRSNDVWNNSLGNYGDYYHGTPIPGQTGLNGNISVDPLLANPALGDYHLLAGSPCIDAGNNTVLPSWLTTDFYGQNRQADGNYDGSVVVDMGAEEYPNPTYTVTYHGNSSSGGTVPIDSTAYYQGNTVTVLGNTGSLVKTNYTLLAGQ